MGWFSIQFTLWWRLKLWTKQSRNNRSKATSSCYTSTSYEKTRTGSRTWRSKRYLIARTVPAQQRHRHSRHHRYNQKSISLKRTFTFPDHDFSKDVLLEEGVLTVRPCCDDGRPTRAWERTTHPYPVSFFDDDDAASLLQLPARTVQASVVLVPPSPRSTIPTTIFIMT